MKVPPGPDGERSEEQLRPGGHPPDVRKGTNHLTEGSLSRWQASSQSKSV
nr:MAG TPA: hypothetical protein [Caudoviricetes sp.]